MELVVIGPITVFHLPYITAEIMIGDTLIEIVACKDRFDELVQFVARLNSEGEHHIGFFGEGEADVRASLAECLIPPSENFVIAYAENELVGVFGVDADSRSIIGCLVPSLTARIGNYRRQTHARALITWISAIMIVCDVKCRMELRRKTRIPMNLKMRS
jgi:hypothetical protein